MSRVMSAGDHRIAPRLGFALPETKFHPPEARPGIVVRTALVEWLAATRAPVITVTGPPGYGKTTLMAQWADRIGPRVAWLSCDDGDNDPVVLLTALAVALDRIEPVDPAIFPALASSGAPISMVPRFVSAVASVQSPLTVLLDHAEAVTNRQCLNAIAEFALCLPPGWQVAQQMVVAVPLPATVERDHEQVPGFQPFEDSPGSPRTQDRVAERPGHPVQDRGTDEERNLRGRDPVEELRAQVVPHIDVIAGEGEADIALPGTGLHRQRGDIQPGRPSLGPPQEVTKIGLVDVGSCPLQQ